MRHRPARASVGFPIRLPAQLTALRSPLRQEILDALASTGPMTVAALAQVLDRAPDALYYHVRLLGRVGLLESCARARAGRRGELLLDVPGRPLHIPHQPGVARYRSAVRGIVAAMLSLARRQHGAAIEDPRTTFAGPGRELWSSRVTGWCTAREVAELNGLLLRVNRLLRPRRAGGSSKLLAFTFVLTPVLSGRRRAPAAAGKR